MEYSQTGGDTFAVYGLNSSRKSRLVAFLLAFFLGMFGAHRFYAGKTGTAIAQLILSITVVGMLISGPWVCVDWIVILCGGFKDDMGRKITRWDN
jgi:TM2 domain-containing membrane protein YozV